jgi:hypothetical protein
MRVSGVYFRVVDCAAIFSPPEPLKDGSGWAVLFCEKRVEWNGNCPCTTSQQVHSIETACADDYTPLNFYHQCAKALTEGEGCWSDWLPE